MVARRKGSEEPEAVRRDGALCATFVNSASAKRKGFSTYAEFLAWGLRCGAVTAGDAERLERAAADHPEDAVAVAARALEVRALLDRIFSARAERRAPVGADLDAFNAELSPALSARRLVPAARNLQWAWGDRGGDDLDRMLWPVLWSAADVLSSKYYSKVGRCAGDGCDLLFVDRAPGSPRKWCNMQACGSKVNSRRHYQQVVKPENRMRKRGIRDPKLIERRLNRLTGWADEEEEPPPA